MMPKKASHGGIMVALSEVPDILESINTGLCSTFPLKDRLIWSFF